ncbi:Holliday junction branch migration protein RuvA [Terrimonas alba]|uniref:Holliday junction branch migration protein RuvA n=1 Tax=Terrimonas alba TaxID=3349636 RepID=UPI0035F2989F
MIAYLKGEFVRKTPSQVYIEVNGVGYEVQVTLNTYTRIQDLEKGLLHTILIIREDAHLLFGFFEMAEKEMFQQLTSVSGIGASTARMMLSYMKPDELATAIVQSDIRTLESIKGIGKKSAERIVLELKDKLAKHPIEANISPLKSNTLHQDAFNALTALGITRSAAEQAVKKVLASEPGLPVEELIKKALRNL